MEHVFHRLLQRKILLQIFTCWKSIPIHRVRWNQSSQFTFYQHVSTDRSTLASHLATLTHSVLSSSSHRPFPSHSITDSHKPPLPCGECARALPFYLFCLCSINLSVELPDAVRVSCIPNSKNNHPSMTGLGRGMLEREKRGVCVFA